MGLFIERFLIGRTWKKFFLEKRQRSLDC